jgi:hypothetical protein
VRGKHDVGCGQAGALPHVNNTFTHVLCVIGWRTHLRRRLLVFAVRPPAARFHTRNESSAMRLG